jgi:hypothetical protein
MKRILMSLTLIVACNLVVLSQTQIGQTQESRKSDNRQMLSSPMIGFVRQSDAPLQMLYSATITIANSSQIVEVELIPKSKSEKTIRSYVVYCIENFASPLKGNGWVKQIRPVNAKKMQPVIFRVDKDSKITFRLASVEFEDGTTWLAK